MEYGVTQLNVNATPTMIAPTESDRWNTVFQSGQMSSSSVRVTHKSVIGYAPFFRGINLIANSVSGLPVNVYRRRGEDDSEVVQAHPAQKLIRRDASEVMAANTFIQTIQGHSLLFGNGYAFIERNERQQPIALWPLDPQNTIIRYADGELWYCSSINSTQVKLPGRNVLHIKGLSHNGIAGYAILDIMADALGVGMAAQQFGGRFFGQGSNMSGLLMVPGSFSEEKIRNTLSAWGEMYEGVTNAHKVALLQDGAKFQQLTIPPEQAQFLETRGFEVRTTVANILGVPPHLLGDETRTSHNSLEQENRSYLVHSVNPWLIEWEAELQRKLLSDRERERGTHFIEFNREALISMEFDKKVDGVYRQMEMGLITLNEGRKLFSMKAVPDGDVRFHPANWLEYGEEPEAGPMEPQAEPEQPDPSEDVLTALIESTVTDAVKFEQRKVVTAARKEDDFRAWLDHWYPTFVEIPSLRGLRGDSQDELLVAYADESKRQLVDAAACSMTSTLIGNVKELFATWGDRTETLIQDLRGIV